MTGAHLTAHINGVVEAQRDMVLSASLPLLTASGLVLSFVCVPKLVPA